MRHLLGVLLVCFPLVLSVGCGESRPDPRENPEFDEESFADPDPANLPGMGDDGALLPPPGVLL